MQIRWLKSLEAAICCMLVLLLLMLLMRLTVILMVTKTMAIMMMLMISNRGAEACADIQTTNLCDDDRDSHDNAVIIRCR